MELEKFYNQINGSASDVLDRLGEESFVKKFIVKFLNDPTYNQLKDALENKNLSKAKFDAHTLKGVCAMLDFVKLKELTEQFMLCLKNNLNYIEVWRNLTNEYNLIIQTINKTNWQF